MPATPRCRGLARAIGGLCGCALVGCLLPASRGGAIEASEAARRTVSVLTGRVADPSAGATRGSRRGLASTAPTGLELTLQFQESSYFLTGAAFVDSMRGWAVGEPHWNQASKEYVGTIIRTTDGGQTWTAQTAPGAQGLNGVAFVDADNGWAVGAGGTILHTTNGGALWTRQAVATSDEFRAVSFVDANNGWAACFRATHESWTGEPDDWRAAIWSTTNGGASWIQQALPAGASILHGVEFVDAQRGWAVGAKYVGDDAIGDPQHRAIVYRTVNGGQDWSEQISDMDLQVTLTAVDFVDASYGWAVGFSHDSSQPDGLTFSTIDGGQTWQRQTPGTFMMGLRAVRFLDRVRGYAVGTGYGSAWGPPVWRTMDGGATWQMPPMRHHEGEGLYGLAVFSDRVIALGDHDFAAISADPWNTSAYLDTLFAQRYLNTHYLFFDVHFRDASEGWAVGSRTYGPDFWGHVILHTGNGGTDWSVQYEKSPDRSSLYSFLHLFAVHFVDGSRGWAVGDSDGDPGAIVHTEDGGQTWRIQGAPLTTGWYDAFRDVRFVDAQEGWALSDSSLYPSRNVLLAHTTDGGTTWQWTDSGIEESLLAEGALDFPDAAHGWAVGHSGTILATSDGGGHWARQTLPSPDRYADLIALDMLDDRRGWACGYVSSGRGGIFSTTDGGQTWSPGRIDTAGNESWWVRDVQFADPLHGWLAGDGGRIRYSSDGGSTWARVENGFSAGRLWGLSFVSPRRGWLVGDAGTILRISSAPSDLSITNSDGRLTAVAGQATVYTITVANAGPGDAVGARVTDRFPAGVSSVQWTCAASGGARCSNGSGSGDISESIDVPSGASVRFVATATLDPLATGMLTTTAAVSAPTDGHDPEPVNNTSSDTDTITAVPATIAISHRAKSVGPGPFVFGSPVRYTLTLGNSGNFAQPDNPGHEMVDVLPAPLSAISAAATSGTALVSGHTVAWDGSIGPGSAVTITIDATVGLETAPGATLSNQAMVSYDADVDGINETIVPTDDPSLPGATDSTDLVIASPAMGYYTIPPCRVLDTRGPAGSYGGPALAAGSLRLFPLFDRCGVPATALAVAVNLTVTGSTQPGNVRIFPARTSMPSTSTVNYAVGQTRANNAVVGLNGLGELAIYCAQSSGTTHVVLDVSGYFE